MQGLLIKIFYVSIGMMIGYIIGAKDVEESEEDNGLH